MDGDILERMSLQEAILDSLADDAENITQIEVYLKYLEITYERDVLVRLLFEMLRKRLIEIVHPLDKNIYPCTDITENLEDFWFRMTEKGRSVWMAIN